MRVLDRTRPFGIISPPHQGIAFQQDGLNFGANGVEIQSAPVPAGERPPHPPSPAAPKIAANARWFALKSFSKKMGGPTDGKDNVLAFLKAKDLIED